MGKYLLFAASGLLSSVAILMLRKAGSTMSLSLSGPWPQSRELLFLGLAALIYVGSFGLWTLILARNEVTVAYPVCFGFTLVISSLLAMAFLSEVLTIAKIAGMLLILAGSVLVIG